MTHSPLPWFDAGNMIGKMNDSSGYEIGYTSSLATGLAEAEANAKFIVRAVNAHDAMLAVLKQVEWAGERDEWVEFSVCPICYEKEPDGHSKNCELKAAIAIADGKP